MEQGKRIKGQILLCRQNDTNGGKWPRTAPHDRALYIIGQMND